MAFPPGLRSPALIPMQAERADRFIEKVAVEDDALAGMPHAALAVLVQPLSQPELHTVVITKTKGLRLLRAPRPLIDLGSSTQLQLPELVGSASHRGLLPWWWGERRIGKMCLS